MRADNKGEGGSLALLALINRSTSDKKRWAGGIVLLGVFACALFYGDSMITPAISVLSAVEGLTTVQASFEPFVIPISIGILVGLFWIQSRGTARVGLMFGPVMILYFVTIAVLGVMHIVDHPSVVLASVNPLNAFHFFAQEPLRAFIAMGSVVLAVTGAEALYADMGHFGRRPIKVSWIYFVLPALLLNYMGQAAMLLSLPAADAIETVKNPFFYPGAGIAAPAAGPAGDRGDDHRQPGGDFGRFLGHPAGDPAGLHAAPEDHPHQRERRRPDLHPGDQLGADDHGHHPRPDLPQLVQPRRRLWHRGDRRDDDRHAC